jgi:hypothetical protein
MSTGTDWMKLALIAMLSMIPRLFGQEHPRAGRRPARRRRAAETAPGAAAGETDLPSYETFDSDERKDARVHRDRRHAGDKEGRQALGQHVLRRLHAG